VNYPKHEGRSTVVPNRTETPVNSADAIARLPISDQTLIDIRRAPGFGMNVVDQTLYARHEQTMRRQMVVEHFNTALRRQFRSGYLLGSLLIALVLMTAVAPTPPSWALIGIGVVASSLWRVGRECIQLMRERGRAKRHFR
jgi:hypothetical protein